MKDSIFHLSISDTKKLLDTKKLSCVELTQAYLKNAEENSKKTNSFITIDTKEALDQAQEADELLSKSESPLCGIPFSMKDVYVTKDVKTTSASDVLEDYQPQYSATVYEKLRRAGAVLIGKNNHDAWGHGGSSENTDFGPVRNPWDLDRVAGGSSGGSAASLTDGSVVFSIGEDTGGSIRNPSSFCNTVGLKVTYGRVSRYGTIAYASSLDTVGPMARSVEDTAILLKEMAGFDPKDASSSRKDVPDYTIEMKKEVKGMKVGVMKEYMGEGLSDEVRDRIMESTETLKKLGVEIEEVSIPTAKYGVSIYYVLGLSETSSNLARYDSVRYGSTRDRFSDDTKRRIMIGTHTLSSGYYDAYYRNALRARTLLINEFNRAFKKFDAIIAPVMPFPAYKFGEMKTDVDYVTAMYLADLYTCTQNPSGIPSLARPVGFSDEGLPIGAQLMGPMFSEDVLFRLGYQYQQATNHHKKRPEL